MVLKAGWAVHSILLYSSHFMLRNFDTEKERENEREREKVSISLGSCMGQQVTHSLRRSGALPSSPAHCWTSAPPPRGAIPRCPRPALPSLVPEKPQTQRHRFWQPEVGRDIPKRQGPRGTVGHWEHLQWRENRYFPGTPRTFIKIHLYLGHRASLKKVQVWFH